MGGLLTIEEMRADLKQRIDTMVWMRWVNWGLLVFMVSFAIWNAFHHSWWLFTLNVGTVVLCTYNTPRVGRLLVDMRANLELMDEVIAKRNQVDKEQLGH